MILTATLNPCIDKTITIEHLSPSGTNRVLESRSDVSGKGINVSMALQNLGVETQCLGFNYTADRALIPQFLTGHHIAHLLVDVGGQLRTNIKIFERDGYTMTEYNEGGSPVNTEAVAAFTAQLRFRLSQLRPNELLVLDGSVPPGVPPDFYRQMILLAKRFHIRTVLDAAGPLLREGLKAAPYAIKPNLAELEDVVGRPLKTIPEICAAAKEIVVGGTAYVCVSMGGEGALLVSQNGCWYAPAMTGLAVKGLQGAGDSLVAGMCMGILQNAPDTDILRYAVAAASGSVCHEGTLLCTRQDFEALLPRVIIRPVVSE